MALPIGPHKHHARKILILTKKNERSQNILFFFISVHVYSWHDAVHSVRPNDCHSVPCSNTTIQWHSTSVALNVQRQKSETEFHATFRHINNLLSLVGFRNLCYLSYYGLGTPRSKHSKAFLSRATYSCVCCTSVPVSYPY